MSITRLIKQLCVPAETSVEEFIGDGGGGINIFALQSQEDQMIDEKIRLITHIWEHFTFTGITSTHKPIFVYTILPLHEEHHLLTSIDTNDLCKGNIPQHVNEQTLRRPDECEIKRNEQDAERYSPCEAH